MTQLKIDPQRKTIDIELSLRGEDNPIQIHISGYDLQPTSDGGDFTVANVNISREWMNLLAAEFLTGRPLHVPDDAMRWLKMAL